METIQASGLTIGSVSLRNELQKPVSSTIEIQAGTTIWNLWSIPCELPQEVKDETEAYPLHQYENLPPNKLICKLTKDGTF